MKKRNAAANTLLCLTFAAGIVSAQPALNLPTTPVTAKTQILPFQDPNTRYALTTLSDVPPGYAVTNSTYTAWCVDQFAPLNAMTQYRLYNTYDPGLPADAQSPYWPNVNWVLNHKPTPMNQATSQTISEVIWHLLNGKYYQQDESAATKATWDAYLARALSEGAGFVPTQGQIVAVLLYLPGGLTDKQFQTLIIEVIVPNQTCTGTIGDFVWSDTNDNGIQDAGEPGINGVTVQLFKGSETTPRATTVTTAAPPAYGSLPAGSNGYYQFTGLCSGAYAVVVNPNQPALVGYTPSPSMQGADRSKDSNGSPAQVTLPTNHSVDETIDFGYHAEAGPVLVCPASTGEVGVLYSSKLVATGGVSPYTFSETGLPSYFTLNSTTGLITGTPATSGPITFTAKVVDSRGGSAGTTTKSCTITIPFACTIPSNAVGSTPTSWNKFNTQGANDVVWVHAHIGSPSGLSAGVTTVDFTGVTFVLNGKTYALPDGHLIFDSKASGATTTFDASYQAKRTLDDYHQPSQPQRRDLLRWERNPGGRQHHQRRPGDVQLHHPILQPRPVVLMAVERGCLHLLAR